MRIALVGAVEGSRIALEALVAANATPAIVLTLPPDKAERHSDFTDLTTPALQVGSDVHHTSQINSDETLTALQAAKPDYCFVIGWSQICGAAFRQVASVGNIGFHPAPLPKLRGRAVIPWTILLGLPETGSTLFWLDAGVDSGDILLQETIPIDHNETAQSLYEKHMQALRTMLPRAVEQLQSGTPAKIAQDHSKATYCAKRTPDDGLIDWSAPASAILRFIRAVGAPYPGAFSFMGPHKIIFDAARPFTNSQQYIGLTGQIQALTDDGFIVRCADGECIEVTAWRTTCGHVPIKTHIKFAPTAAGSP